MKSRTASEGYNEQCRPLLQLRSLQNETKLSSAEWQHMATCYLYHAEHIRAGLTLRRTLQKYASGTWYFRWNPVSQSVDTMAGRYHG